MSTPIIHRIANRAPEFPCWLYGSITGRWRSFTAREYGGEPENRFGYTHWCRSDRRPTTSPEEVFYDADDKAQNTLKAAKFELSKPTTVTVLQSPAPTYQRGDVALEPDEPAIDPTQRLTPAPTPETDAALQSTANTTAIFVFADFARKLERERDEARALANDYHTKGHAIKDERDQAMALLAEAHEDRDKLLAETHALRAELHEEKQKYSAAYFQWREEIATLKAEVERLNSGIEDEAISGDHNLTPSYQAEIAALKAQLAEAQNNRTDLLKEIELERSVRDRWYAHAKAAEAQVRTLRGAASALVQRMNSLAQMSSCNYRFPDARDRAALERAEQALAATETKETQ